MSGGFNSDENKLRWLHATDAAQKALQKVHQRETFDALAAIEEAQIILRAIYNDEEIVKERGRLDILGRRI